MNVRTGEVFRSIAAIRTVRKPVTFTVDEDKRFFSLQIVRIALALVFTAILTRLLNISMPNEYLSLAAIAGVLMAGRLLNRRYTFAWVFLVHAALFLAIRSGLAVWNANSGSADPLSDFRVAMIADSTFLLLLWYSAAFLSTWLFWCRDWAV